MFELIFCHPCFDVICACTEFFGEVVYFTELLELRVICEKLMVYRMACNDVRERCGVQDKENGPQHRALRHTILELYTETTRALAYSVEAKIVYRVFG